jgi:hypothetical protein
MIYKLLIRLHRFYSYTFNDMVPTRWLVRQGMPYGAALLPGNVGKNTKYIALRYYHSGMSIDAIAKRCNMTRERVRLYLAKAARGG